jgi:hypothetical protein
LNLSAHNDMFDESDVLFFIHVLLRAHSSDH